jgi:hypothetical protein
LSEAMMKPGPCQVRSSTGSPCLRSAEVEILGVAFCGPCAREQEAYFAIGELTHEEEQDFHSKALATALKMMRRERAGIEETVAAELHHGLAGTREPEPIALTNSLLHQQRGGGCGSTALNVLPDTAVRT